MSTSSKVLLGIYGPSSVLRLYENYYFVDSFSSWIVYSHTEWLPTFEMKIVYTAAMNDVCGAFSRTRSIINQRYTSYVDWKLYMWDDWLRTELNPWILCEFCFIILAPIGQEIWSRKDNHNSNLNEIWIIKIIVLRTRWGNELTESQMKCCSVRVIWNADYGGSLNRLYLNF